ncbi:MAG: tetraacyldisaccharide 4'-kinase [bacterium]
MGIREKVVAAFSRGQASGRVGLLGMILIPLSLVYQLVMAVRSFLYAYGLIASRRLVRPVISVGNLTAGGTGKTPLVIKIVQHLTLQGLGFAVLSRGYKGKSTQAVNTVSDLAGIRLGARESGDEPYLMAGKLPGTPVLVGKDRFALGNEAILRFDPDCLILDDGFQHLSLSRECNILLLDGEFPFGNGLCLPSGSLREGASAIRRADLIAVTGEPSEAVLSRIRSLAPGVPLHIVRFTASGLRRLPSYEVEPLSMLQGKRVMAFAGIARPERFFRSIEGAGAELVHRRSFPDHYPYSSEEAASLFSDGLEHKVDCLITTEKDAVRFPEVPQELPLFALVLSVELHDPDGFFGEVRRCLSLAKPEG